MYHLMLELHQKYVSCLGIKKRGVHINTQQIIPLNCKVTVEGSKESSSTYVSYISSIKIYARSKKENNKDRTVKNI